MFITNKQLIHLYCYHTQYSAQGALPTYPEPHIATNIGLNTSLNSSYTPTQKLKHPHKQTNYIKSQPSNLTNVPQQPANKHPTHHIKHFKLFKPAWPSTQPHHHQHHQHHLTTYLTEYRLHHMSNPLQVPIEWPGFRSQALPRPLLCLAADQYRTCSMQRVWLGMVTPAGRGTWVVGPHLAWEVKKHKIK